MRAQTEWGPGIIGTGNAGGVAEAERGAWKGRLYVPSADQNSGWTDYHVYGETPGKDRVAGFRR